MQVARIVLLALGAAIIYGVIHDQLTVRISLEYFTIGHPELIESQSPTLLALAWGVVATWWVGLPLGFGLAIVGRAGRAPKKSAEQLVVPIGRLLITMALAATIAGIVGHTLARVGIVRLVGPFASSVPEDRQIGFITALWAHNASYAFGILGGVVLLVVVRRSRTRHHNKANKTE